MKGIKQDCQLDKEEGIRFRPEEYLKEAILLFAKQEQINISEACRRLVVRGLCDMSLIKKEV